MNVTMTRFGLICDEISDRHKMWCMTHHVYTTLVASNGHLITTLGTTGIPVVPTFLSCANEPHFMTYKRPAEVIKAGDHAFCVRDLA